MNNGHQEAEREHLHRIAQLLKPKRRQLDIRPAEEGRGDDVHRVPEEGAEHKAPEHRGNAAVEEHLQSLPHTGFHIFLLREGKAAADRHDQPVPGIGKHHTEEHIVKQRNQRGRVKLVL